ncbi:MAG: MATE family efflux transporter, partial [Catalinimonas sp.]
NLGAGRPDRAERSVWRAAGYNMLFLGAVAVCFFTLSGPIMQLFTDDPAAVRWGRQCLRILSLGYVFYALGMVVSQSFNGAGDTRTPTLLNLVGFWVIQVPLAYGLALTWERGPTGVFAAIAASEALLALMSVWVFRRGRWKRVKV